ncbi:MAG: tRNA (adenosine(37)-N6)-dimethylallyltransferase MiaA [Acidobacteria bacterium]|nr:tRNA (adenosine(37)-N6)-dimethylallyltransferase MiaA [Acidobacteriota bacterium]
MSERPPLLVIAGPTGSGKSRLALDVAERLDGEIVSADAFAVYRGLDIGTDKPPLQWRRRIRHHLIDIADPVERYSAGRFAAEALAAVGAIRSRGKLPIVAGGTHFYIRALVLGLFPEPPRDPTVREALERDWASDAGRVYARLQAVDPVAAAAIAPGDRQRILRALEVFEAGGKPISRYWAEHRRHVRFRTLLAAPQRARRDLYVRIERRVESMFSSGLEAEVRRLVSSGVPPTAHAFKAIGYREVIAHMDGRWDLAEAEERTKIASRQLAKRQLTWLRHAEEGRVVWVPPPELGGGEEIAALWRHHLEEGTRGAT